MAEQKDFFNKKHYSFCLFSGINTESIKPLVELLKNIEENSILDLYINSRGGYVLVAIGIFNLIKTIKKIEINTYNLGHCDSAATLLFLLGKKRIAIKNSTFFMHSLQINFTQPQTINSLNMEIQKLKTDTNTMISLLANNSSLTKKEWSMLMSDKGNLIKARKALAIGIVDNIFEGKDIKLLVEKKKSNGNHYSNNHNRFFIFY